MECSGVIARSLLRGLGVPLVQLDLPAARAKALAHCSTRDASAHDGGLPIAGRRRFARGTDVGRDQHLALFAEAFALLHGEPGGFQGGAQRCGHAPRRRGRARGGEARERAHELRRPHVRVLGRREAVEIEGVGNEPQVAGDLDVGKEQRQDDVAVVELESMPARNEHRPARMQLGGFVAHLGVGGMGELQVGQGEGVLLERHEVQAPAARRVAPPRLERDEEVEAQAEAGLDDDEALAPCPALRQRIAAEEHMALLLDAAVRVVIAVAVDLGIRRPFLERESCRNQRANAESFLAPSPTFWPP